MPALGVAALGVHALPSSVYRDPPTPNITAPIGTITTSTTTVTWTYDSSLARAQTGYRVVLATVSGGFSVVFDSGLIAGDDTSHDLEYTLTPFTSYRILVGVSDGLDGAEDPVFFSPGWGAADFFTEFSATAIYDDVPSVGRVYEVAINGVGYMLVDHPELEHKYRRQTIQLAPERFATGDTPFSEAIDRYTFIGHSDWRSGEGQTYLDRPFSDTARYSYSEWINPFEPGQITLNKTPTLHIADTYVGGVDHAPTAVVASGSVFMQASDTDLTGRDTPEGSNTTFSTGLAGAITSMTSDGNNWYATDGATIVRNTTAANPGGNWSTVDVTEIAWCTDRIMGLDTVTGPKIVSFDTAGTATTIFTHATSTLRGLCGGDGFVWYGVNNNTTGHVRYWQVDSSPTTGGIGLTLPEGESVDSLYFYLGNVFIATRVNDLQKNRKIYRGIPNEGQLTPELIVEIEAGGTHPAKTSFAGMGRFVAFAWPHLMQVEGDGPVSGIGVFDLESGGYARWQSAGGSDGTFGLPVTGVVSWAGDFGFVLTSSDVDGGFYGLSEDDPDACDLHEGFLITSVSDLASNVTKSLTTISLTTQPLAGEVELFYSPNNNETFTSLGTMTGSGVTTTEFGANVFGSSFGFKAILSPSGAEGPIVKLIVAKTHPVGMSDQVVTLPINCSDQLNALNQGLIPTNAQGRGRLIARTLESLVGSLVAFQDVDYADSMESDIYQMVSADLTEFYGGYVRNQSKRMQHAVCTVTLRRALS